MAIPSTYTKPFLTVDEQLDRLSARGMTISDRDQAYQQLQALGYYRLSGYWYPFRLPATGGTGPRPSVFQSGTSFESVLGVYSFDERLRSAVMRALASIEVAMRFRIGHLLGQKHQFAHMRDALLRPEWRTPELRTSPGPQCTAACDWTESKHDEWTARQRRNESRSNEAFVAHMHKNYGEPLPVWTATEVMSFGTLNLLFGGMTQTDRQQVAVEFDIFTSDGNGDAATLTNWLEHLRQTRNICAHHSRLWNRNHTVPLALSELAEFQHLEGSESGPHRVMAVSRPASRVYGTLVLISYLMARIVHSNSVRDELRQLVEDFAASDPDRLRAMGFPEGWDQQDIWQASYARDPNLAQQARMLRDVQLLYTSDAAALMTVKATIPERKSHLNFYRKHGALLSVPGTDSHRYPSFQFDTTRGDVDPICLLANRRLLDGGTASETDRWNALGWWVTPRPEIPGELSPRRALETNVLDRQLVDKLLTSRGDEEPLP